MKIFAWFRTLLFVTLLFPGFIPGPAAAADLGVADELLGKPNLDLDQALKALDLYKESLARARPPQAPILARLARTCFVLGELTVPSQRQKYYQQGQTYAEMILKEQPARVEGRYWLALHLCGLAETGGSMQGLRLLPRIISMLDEARAVDETYDQAGCHRVLGRIYFEAPAWPFSVGDLEKSRQHLTRAVLLAPENSTNHLYLGETLMRLREPEQARRELQRVLQCTSHNLMFKCLEEDRQEARRLLETLRISAEDN